MTSLSSASDVHDGSFRRRRDCQPRLRTVSIILALLASSLASATASALRDGRPSSRPPPLRRERRERRRAAAEEQEEEEEAARGQSTKSNDDSLVATVPLRPFSLKLSNLPAASPVSTLAAVDVPPSSSSSGASENAPASGAVPAMDALLEYVTGLGTRAFGESPTYGERFLGWDVGSRWSAARGHDDFVLLGAAAPSSVETEDGRDELPLTEVGRSSGLSTTSLTVVPSTLLTLGYGGTVTLKATYLVDDPSSEELTEFLVREMNSDASREGLLEKLRPLACSAEVLIAQECNVALEVVASGDENAEVEEYATSAVEEGGAQDAAAAEDEMPAATEPAADGTDGSAEGTTSDPSEVGATDPKNDAPGDGSDGDGTAIPSYASNDFPATDPAFIDTTTNTLEAIPSDSDYPAVISSARAADQGRSEGADTPLQIIVPILIVVPALAALVVLFLLVRRRRERRRRSAMEELPVKVLPALPPGPADAATAYDAIAGPAAAAPSGKGDSSSAATPGASVGATSLAAAAGASPGARGGDSASAATASNGVEEENGRSTSKDAMLPADVRRSDSASTAGSVDRSIMQMDDYSGLV